MKKTIFPILLIGGLFLNRTYAQTDTSGREKVYRATHTKTTELKHTKLKVNFDFNKEQLNGEEWLTASPYFYATDSLVLNAKSMNIGEVALDQGGNKRPLKYTYQNDMLKINLDKVYTKDQDYTVYIKYVAKPNEVKQVGSAAINDAKGLYFINAQSKDTNNPTQIWTQGETESNSCWFPTIDKPNQKSTEEIYITVPDKYVTLSNGLLADSRKESDGNRTDHWVMDKRHSVYLFFMGIGEYSIIKDKWRDKEVNYYVEKEYEPYARQIFGNTPEMIEFYSKKLNYDFPWQKYSQIVGRDYVSGAMENTTAVLHQESANQKEGDLVDENKWEDVIAHELFHHWFGDLVTAESWSNLTVNESFADYSEYLWEEYKYGKDAAEYHQMKSLDQYKAIPGSFSKNLVRFDYASREDVFDNVTYNKGGGILHMLRKYLGDDAFFAGLSDYLKTYQYGTGEAHQLRLSLEKVSGKDLNWFFNQWYYSNGHPKLDINYSYEPVKKQIKVTVGQTQASDTFFQFPLSIDVYEGSKPVRYNVWVDAKSSNEFSFTVNKQPDLVNVDPEGIILGSKDDKKTAQQYYYQFANAKDFRSRYAALEFAVKNLDKDDAAIKTLLQALNDPFFRIRTEALEGIDLTKPAQAKLLLSTVEKLAVSDPKTLVQAAAISALAKTKDKKYLPIYEKGLTAVSNAVRGNSLAALSDVSPEKVAAMADKVDLSNADENLITSLLPTIVKNKIEKQMAAIAPIVGFYPFIGYQRPELAQPTEEGYNWVMESDNLEATKRLTSELTKAKSQIGENPQAKMIIIKILKDGLDKKMALLKANPSSPTLGKQIELINKVIESYK